MWPHCAHPGALQPWVILLGPVSQGGGPEEPLPPKCCGVSAPPEPRLTAIAPILGDQRRAQETTAGCRGVRMSSSPCHKHLLKACVCVHGQGGGRCGLWLGQSPSAPGQDSVTPTSALEALSPCCAPASAAHSWGRRCCFPANSQHWGSQPICYEHGLVWGLPVVASPGQHLPTCPACRQGEQQGARCSL